ncbi:MAG: hypothetical protein WDO18_20680 [Acidobacteriota bacterium]
MATDTIALTWLGIRESGALRLGAQEFELRIFPGVVHLFGLISFGLGLQIFNPRGLPIRRILTPSSRSQLFQGGLIIMACGLALFGIGLRLVGAGDFDSFYSVVDQFRSEELSFGGFWYRGADIALFGLALMFATAVRPVVKLGLLVAVVMTPMILTSNKGGLEKSLIYLAFLLFAFDSHRFRRFAKARIVVPAALLLVFAIGLKNSFIIASRQGNAKTESVLTPGVPHSKRNGVDLHALFK